MMPFDAYKQYLSLKNHFTKEKYDYHKYCGKSRATVQSFYKRKDRFWFEKLAGEMIREGEGRYTSWKRRTQSLSYVFKEEMESVLANRDINDAFASSNGHSPILKGYLSGDISLETMVICDKILDYRTDYDKKLTDPVWETVSMRMRKYSPFLNIDVPHYKKILKEMVHGT